jgi:hypothetical protein
MTLDANRRKNPLTPEEAVAEEQYRRVRLAKLAEGVALTPSDLRMLARIIEAGELVLDVHGAEIAPDCSLAILRDGGLIELHDFDQDALRSVAVATPIGEAWVLETLPAEAVA